MGFKMIGAGAAWRGYYDRLPSARRDVFFSSDYADLNRGADWALAAVYEDGAAFVLEPLLLRAVEGGAGVDAGSLYGFGGPVSNSDAPALFEAFRDGLRDWFERQGIIAVRRALHPLYGPLQRRILDADPPELKRVVVIDLRNDLLAQMRATKRQELRKAQDLGFEFCSGAGLAAQLFRFGEEYQAFAAAKQMKPRHRFPPGYFAGFQRFGEDCGVATVYGPAGALARALVLFSAGTAYYHFAIRCGAASAPGAGERLVYEIARVARDRGYQRLHLGGGVTADPHDSLLMFKYGFSSQTEPVYVVNTVIDRDAYARACAAAYQQHGPAPGGLFPEYRRGI